MFRTSEKTSGESLTYCKCVVPAAGVEPATFRSGGERSNPLSYAGLKCEKDSIVDEKRRSDGAAGEEETGRKGRRGENRNAL